MAENKVKIKALVVLRAPDGKKVKVGQEIEVLQSVADILIKSKKAEIVK